MTMSVTNELVSSQDYRPGEGDKVDKNKLYIAVIMS